MTIARTLLLIISCWLLLPASIWAEAWLDNGWKKLDAGEHNAALRIWQQGVNAMPESRLLPSVGVFAHFPYALEQLKQIGPGFGAFLVRHEKQGRMLYFVLSTRPLPLDRKQRQQSLADLKQAAGVTGVLVGESAGTFRLEPVPVNFFTLKQTRPSPKPVPARRLETKTIKASQPAIKIDAPFIINRFAITGNKHITTDMILMSLRDFYGRDKTKRDLQLIRDRVRMLYHGEGMTHVQVRMPQPVDEESVQITILEHE